MKLVLISIFFFSSFAYEAIAQELKLQCMDATGTEKSFLIFKETNKVLRFVEGLKEQLVTVA